MTERTRVDAIRRAGTAYADAIRTCAQMTPREQAEAAHVPDGPSVDELEDRIRARRGMEPRDRDGRRVPS
jgi:hypothetical protein